MCFVVLAKDKRYSTGPTTQENFSHLARTVLAKTM
jgi:hypothetical protein